MSSVQLYYISPLSSCLFFVLQLIESACTMDEAVAAGLKLNDKGMLNKKPPANKNKTQTVEAVANSVKLVGRYLKSGKAHAKSYSIVCLL